MGGNMDEFKKKQIMLGAVAFVFALIAVLAIGVSLVKAIGWPMLVVVPLLAGVAYYLAKRIKVK
jgi:hypothetical protein